MRIRESGHPRLTTGPYLFLAYVQRFNIIPAGGTSNSQVDMASGMYTLRRATRSDGSQMGDVIPLMHISSAVQLTPKLGAATNSHLTMQTSLKHSTEFWLNKYEEKENFGALHTY